MQQPPRDEPSAAARSDFRHLERLRVRWAEVDMQQIVFNGHYLMYFDTAVAGYWRALALPYHETMARLGGDLYVRKATLEYEGSARYDDLLDIGMRCARIGNSSMLLQAAAFRGEQRLVHGDLVYVFADPATQTARPVPPALREILQAFEAGAPMIDMCLGDWAALGAEARAIRDAVLVREQGLPAGLAHDDADEHATHALARNRLGQAVATARLQGVAPGVAQIGRVAVVAGLRGAGAGRALLQALLAAARQRGEREVQLHAQASAVGFFARAGFAPRGADFEAAGRLHQEMFLRL